MVAASPSTLIAPVTLSGVGLFTAAPVRLTIHPAPTGSGIAFRRVDLPGAAEREALIPALATHVVPESRRTVLAADPDEVRAAIGTAGPAAAATMPTVQTVEHLLSALAGLGIRDALIEVDGPEIPIGDGSAKIFIDALMGGTAVLPTTGRGAPASAGARADKPPAALLPPRQPIIITEPIRLAEDGSLVEALPLSPTELAAANAGSGPATFFSYHLDYSNFPIASLASVACRRVRPQKANISLPLVATAASRDEYTREVAPARTYCLAEEAQAMRRAGLFAHLTPRDMLVIGDEGPIDNAYRFVGADGQSSEPARHKLLDLIGDLSLTGRPILGRIVATRSGHAQNHEMALRLMNDTHTR